MPVSQLSGLQKRQQIFSSVVAELRENKNKLANWSTLLRYRERREMWKRHVLPTLDLWVINAVKLHLIDLIYTTPGGGDAQRDSTKSHKTAWEASQRVKSKRWRLGHRERIGSLDSDGDGTETRISGIGDDGVVSLQGTSEKTHFLSTLLSPPPLLHHPIQSSPSWHNTPPAPAEGKKQ